MPTRIFFQNGDQVTVSDAPEAVAEKLAAGGFARLDRPWGDESIYVNPAAINYIESQEERAPDIDALQAIAEPVPTGGAPQAPGQVPPTAPGQFPPR
jgi:hypothetical protein